MKLRTKYLYTTLFLLISNFCFSQGFDLGSWNILNIKYKINEKWNVFGELQIRSLKFYKNFHYHEYKAGVNFKAHQNVTLTLAAGDYDTYKEGGNFIKPKNNDEFRVWPQITLLQPVGKFKIEQRYRAEFRFTSDGYKNRFRYRLGISYPLKNNRQEYKPYLLSLSNEIFFTDREPYFERNRILLSLAQRISNTFSMQIGYLHQFDYKINDETGRDFLQMGFYIELAKQTKR